MCERYDTFTTSFKMRVWIHIHMTTEYIITITVQNTSKNNNSWLVVLGDTAPDVKLAAPPLPGALQIDRRVAGVVPSRTPLLAPGAMHQASPRVLPWLLPWLYHVMPLGRHDINHGTCVIVVPSVPNPLNALRQSLWSSNSSSMIN